MRHNWALKMAEKLAGFGQTTTVVQMWRKVTFRQNQPPQIEPNPPTINGLSADYVFYDEAGKLP